jgi:hypothetical protein
MVDLEKQGPARSVVDLTVQAEDDLPAPLGHRDMKTIQLPQAVEPAPEHPDAAQAFTVR